MLWLMMWKLNTAFKNSLHAYEDYRNWTRRGRNEKRKRSVLLVLQDCRSAECRLWMNVKWSVLHVILSYKYLPFLAIIHNWFKLLFRYVERWIAINYYTYQLWKSEGNLNTINKPTICATADSHICPTYGF